MKKIFLIAVVFILFVFIGVVVFLVKNIGQYSGGEKEGIEDRMISGKEACLNSGGKVSIISCCNSTGDFPNTCLAEICDCLTKDSDEIQVCDCGLDRCFDGEKCLMPEVSQPSGVDESI